MGQYSPPDFGVKCQSPPDGDRLTLHVTFPALHGDLPVRYVDGPTLHANLPMVSARLAVMSVDRPMRSDGSPTLHADLPMR